jgi:hypothetical protein
MAFRSRSHVRGAWFAAAFLVFSSTSSAAVTEPDLITKVPKASADPIQLNSFFSSRGEPIHWITDAASTPNSFSPLCGFTASFVLHGADCSLALAWYNETGTPPTDSDLHTVIPAGSSVGTSFTGTSIKNDPDYQGGLVGFALVGKPGACPQTHYSNPSWNQTCTSCNPAAPWITTLIYPSETTPNAFYLAFEDGPTSATSFNNDGDFNDAVYFISGITCAGGGQACDTGEQGICAAGITQCTATGTTCQQLSTPDTEKCNGLDDNCDGQTDEGDDLCPSGLVCDKGRCVASCQHGEFACQGGKVCSTNGHCVDPGCQDVTCEAGTVCINGTCTGPCDGVVCPYGQVCRVGACVDPCAGVTCGSEQVCDNGVCVSRCDCLPCAEDKTCVASTGLCIDSACADVTCEAGMHCQAGACLGPCEGVVCPTGQVCSNDQCIDSPPDAGTDAGAGASSGLAPDRADAGTIGDFGARDVSGCGCNLVGESTGSKMALAGAALALAVLGRRRARKGR